MRLNFIFSGESPWGWHLLSVLKHLSVAVLLGLLVWKLLRDRVAALLAGALFALHPAQAESVAWISVPDSLMSVAILGSVASLPATHPKASPQPGRRKPQDRIESHGSRSKVKPGSSAIWLYASAAACLAAMMAKETAIVLPAIFFAVALVAPADSRRDAAPGRTRHTGSDGFCLARDSSIPGGDRGLPAFAAQRSGRPDQSPDSAFAAGAQSCCPGPQLFGSI